MIEKEIKTLNGFREIIGDHAVRKYLYRGQNNYEYKLESSLLRAFSRNKELRFKKDFDTKKFNSLRYEEEMLESFKRSGHIFLQHFPDDNSNFDWLALMQHYGAPTRLLDFTFSPYIALYFAISGASNKAAAVYCIDYDELRKKSLTQDLSVEKLFDNVESLDETNLVCFEPSFVNERLFVQQGVFLVPNTLNFSHEKILAKYASSDFVTKIKIKPMCFAKIIKELYKMNITASTLFPGFEGFCKSFEHIGVIPINAMQHLPDL